MKLIKQNNKNSVINDWIYIDDLPQITADIKSLHCDTRSFHVEYSEEPLENGDSLFKVIKYQNANNSAIIEAKDIHPFLKNMETISGGKGKWRMLSFKHVEDTIGWLKYIRLYRYNESQFVVCNSRREPIDWKSCTENSLYKGCLNQY